MNQRVTRLQQVLGTLDIEALLVTSRHNCHYISQFTGTSGALLITQQDAILLTDFRYLSQVAEQAPDFTLVEHLGSQLYQKVAEVCQQLGIHSLHFEAEALPFSEYDELRSLLQNILLHPTIKLIEELRANKEESELYLIKEAIHIAEVAFQQLLTELSPGITERRAALRLEWLMREGGASGLAFDMIVASGARSALPHGVATDKVLERGDLVTFDFGCFYQGYASDITRTIALGSCTTEEREIYEIVRLANERTIAGIRAGMLAKDIDAIAREFISQAGYGEQFGHGTGHGFGLEIHEYPRLGKLSDEKVTERMAVTIEPGIYLANRFGVRIEDDVFMKQDGCEVLTSLSKELIIL
jgi:Xaa-Pro aminopeptidase